LLWNIFKSIRSGEVAPPDPWDANTLEWYTDSPPSLKNFERVPPVTSDRPLYDFKHSHQPDDAT